MFSNVDIILNNKNLSVFNIQKHYYIKHTPNTTHVFNIKFILFLRKHLAYTFNFYWFILIWKGKAFRIRFSKKQFKFIFRFGASHKKRLLYSLLLCKIHKFKRQRYFILFAYRKFRRFIIETFHKVRILGKYTRRGLRLKPHALIRRFGKVSQLNQYLHGY